MGSDDESIAIVESGESQGVRPKRLAPDDLLLVAVFWSLGLIVFAQFFSRYALNHPLGWTEEIARYLLIWLTFLGAATAVRRRSHITVSFFYRYIPLPIGRILSVGLDVAQAAFCLCLAGQAYAMTFVATQEMSSLPLPKSIIYYGLVIFFLVMGARTCANARATWQGQPGCPLLTARRDFQAKDGSGPE